MDFTEIETRQTDASQRLGRRFLRIVARRNARALKNLYEDHPRTSWGEYAHQLSPDEHAWVEKVLCQTQEM